ncbi:MAG: hypothetical protein R2731_10315 [Nocardioides sp.]
MPRSRLGRRAARCDRCGNAWSCCRAIVVGWFVGIASGCTAGPAIVLRLGWLGLSVGAAVWQVRRLSSAVGAPYLQELAHGYTTLRLHWGTLWNVAAPGRSITFRQPWDYRGIWVLDSGGRVQQTPQPGILPPGMYPSPHQAGQFELWTGAGWAGVMRRPPGGVAGGPQPA